MKKLLAKAPKFLQWSLGTHVGRMITSFLLGVIFIAIYSIIPTATANIFYDISLVFFGFSGLYLVGVLIAAGIIYLKLNVFNKK